MENNRPIVAMIYDFDGTLAPGNMQEYDFLKEIGISDKDGRAVWPAAAIDFTAKMQILYMINKGVERISDNKEINNFMTMSERRIPFDHMI